MLSRAGKSRILVSILVLAIPLAFFLFLAGCGDEGTAPVPSTRTQTQPGSTSTAQADEPAASVPPPATQPETSEVALLTDAAIRYARSNNPSLPQLRVLTVRISGDWARVDLEPVDGSTDMASALLRRSQGTWTVVDFGYILPQNHPDAPPEVLE